MKKLVFILLILPALNNAIAQYLYDDMVGKVRICDWCVVTREHSPSDDHFMFSFIYFLAKEVGIEKADYNYRDTSDRVLFRIWWKSNYKYINCKADGDAFPAGGLLKQIVMSNFEMIMPIICGPKSKYELDLNVKDPVDSLTIMDWIELRLNDTNPDTKLWEGDIEMFIKFQKLFKEAGAKTSEELKKK